MTITTTDSADSGEVARLVGEERTVIIRRDTVGEATRNLAHDIAGLPPRRRPAADETVTQMRLIEPALGLNHHDMDRVVEMDETVIYREPNWLAGVSADLDGELTSPSGPFTPPTQPKPAPPGKRSVPYVIPADAEPWFGPRHRKPAPAWTRWAIAVGTLLAIWSAVTLAVIL